MEQVEIFDAAVLPNALEGLARLPSLALGEKSSSQSLYQSASHHGNASAPFYPGPTSWLSCQCADGWGPLSAKYNDLTPCFLQGVLYVVAGVLMVTISTKQLYTLYQRKMTSGNKANLPFYVRLALTVLQFAFSISLYLSYAESFDIIKFGLVLNIASLVFAFGLHYLEHFKASISSGVLLFYWLFQIFFNLGRIINLNLRHDKKNNFFAVSILAAVNAFFVLVLEINFPPLSSQPYSKQLSIAPYDKANIFSRIAFNWMAPLMKKGFYQFLAEKDMPFLPSELKAGVAADKFYHYWNASATPSLFFTLAKAFGGPFLIGGAFKGLQDILAFTQPQLLRLLISFVNDYSESLKKDDPIPLTKGLMIAAGMFLVSVVQTAFLHQYFQRAFDLGMKIKSSMISVIYNKSLVLSNEMKQQSNTGDIVNLMSVDTQRLQDLVQNLQIIWSGPFQIVLCLYSLHGLLGNSMWAGVAIMVIMIPLNAVIARTMKNLQKTQMKYKDARSRLISEILNNIKSLKLYGWEDPYMEKLKHVRNEQELRNLKRMGMFGALSTSTWSLTPILVSCSTFALFVINNKDKTLSTDIVFPALSLFNLLSFPLAVVPMVITNIVESQVAISRLTKFLNGSELQSNAVTKLPKASSVGDVAVSIKNGTFLWSKQKGEESYKVALSNINLSVKKGELDCIVGKVGSGKSSVLQSLLGDLYKLDGEVKVRGKVAYVSQVPWIVNGSVKENILFGHKDEPEFYQKVLKACALTVDLKILPKGDRTEVGEKGISLSGGQKARLALARAVYARADVYLLDDPLSAVDEHVGRHLIDHVLGPNGLLKSKCKILATNAIHVLSIADNMHMVKDGSLVEQGTYLEIMSQERSQLRQLILSFGKKRGDDSTVPSSSATSVKGGNSDLDDLKGSGTLESSENSSDFEVSSLRRASDATLITDEERLLRSTDEDEEEEEDEDAEARKEKYQQGKVKWDVYKSYARACGPVSVLIFLSSTIVSMTFNVSSNVWLKHWSEVNTEMGFNPSLVKYLGIYFLLGFGYSISMMSQMIVMWILCTINGSKKMHNDMATSVLRAPMSFFETTPIGRILNRFSNDIYKIDEVLGRVFAMFFTNSARVLFTILVICYSTWQFIFIALPLSVLYVYYQQYYLKTSRELRRLDSVSRSPIFANFQESLNGVSIIRAYGQEDRFKFLNQARIDKNMRAYHPSVNANRWLAVRLEFLGSLIILASSGLAILTLKSSGISAGLVGLSVSYALQITQSLNWIVRMTVEVETNIVSVERVLEYSELTPEAPEIIEDNRPPASWPAKGELIFKNYSTRYRPELDLVLKNVNLKVKPHEKIGIVGRTGAGKSSLTLALFRIIEAAEGHIEIDNLDTSKLGLQDVRHNLSIIPQDAQVFEGTIRDNLDPSGAYTDEAIWKALELSHLKDHVLKMYEERDAEEQDSDNALDVKMSEGGSNLSVGQRQLMCLARALLIPSHILVLDEATAAVDVETDRVLQDTIRTEFKDRTILTIAHRLNTIMDSDRIVVLEQGEVAEFDSPENLLKNKDSLFYALSKQGGLVEDDEGAEKAE
ncbi:hypothetical protein FT663_03860 [Candidozyma haemuli var. vulneris]|uniref:Metal resistance protein YCF1 n=1 Tax=Candidozyma haemuli TaxID=45357 RepID=A0A2V1AXU0_9ASCO|nr:hypothetical protein CXQ85_002632 [[Candida] haemuloni]KAF3988772.1 hypothetical protein FT662_03222 [[Candida] haemuloni var. vulneris]KAF3988887.1 hypothetical protein FT663_03860 [[Candida] haemuloni var. vulneris]PVH22907.1 hypothetical protein CXQ85_002632 [[Candida] haemuloni]